MLSVLLTVACSFPLLKGWAVSRSDVRLATIISAAIAVPRFLISCYGDEIRNLSMIFPYRLHAPKERQSKRHVLGFLAKRLALEALRDGMRARFRAPCVRGALRALQYAPALLALDLETLGPEYAKLQDQLCQSG
jgi:hypothetical protein